jgi:DME family drug/metabolite transporter
MRNGIIWVALAATLWGTAGIVAKTLLAHTTLSPVTLGFLRLSFSTPGLLAYGLWRDGRPFLHFHMALDKRAVFVIAAGIAAYQAFYYAAVTFAGVALPTLVSLCLAPVLVVILTAVVFREKTGRRVLFAVALALTGTALLVGLPTGDSGKATLIGAALACGSAFSYASLTVAGRIAARHMDGPQVVVVAFSGGAVLLLPVALWQGIPLDFSLSSWGLLLYLALVPTALSYALFFHGMKTTPPTIASIVSLLEPLTGTLLATFVLGEHLGPTGIIGAVLLVLGLLVVSTDKR